jgi:hypothetical protein
MQLMPRYLVLNRIDIIANVAGFITEYRPVYKRQLQVYKGIDNVIEFRLLNAEQRPIVTAGYIPKFVAFDENKNLVIERDGVVLDDGSSATKGLFTVTITENDLLNLKDQYLSYNIYLVDSNNEKLLTYTDSHFGNDATIKISSETFPGAKESKVIQQFTRVDQDDTVYISETLDAEPGINGNEALHTAVIYTDGYNGTVTVQGTLENQVTDFTNWADLAVVNFDGTETAPTPINFNGVLKYVRFKTSQTPADKIVKILVRN